MPEDVLEGWYQLEAGYFCGACFVAMYSPSSLEISFGESSVAADDSGRSFLPNQTFFLPFTVLQAILGPQRLFTHTEADHVVLKASARVPTSRLLCIANPRGYLKRPVETPWAKAELARRRELQPKPPTERDLDEVLEEMMAIAREAGCAANVKLTRMNEGVGTFR